MADPFSLVRALNRMRAAGFEIRAAGDLLQVSPIGRLTDPQRTYLQANKAALLALLADAETLASALVQAGPAGLGWREWTPDDWTDIHLLAVGEVLYADGRMVSTLNRRYAAESAPTVELGPEYPPADCVAETAPHAATDSPPANPLATRVAELTAQGWSPWNARARAEAETNRPKVSP